MMAELAYIKLRIEERPEFATIVDPDTEESVIHAETPEGYHLLPGNREFSMVSFFTKFAEIV